MPDILTGRSTVSVRIYLFLHYHAHSGVYRPGSLCLPSCPLLVSSSPDGACLLAITEEEGVVYLRAYHWASFGSKDGFCFQIPRSAADSILITSLYHRGHVHVLFLDIAEAACKSLALNITQEVTEFTFRPEGLNAINQRDAPTTSHNCLIDCHSAVWTRFPVVPAISRQAIVSQGDRQLKQLLFIVSHNHQEFRSYFQELIQTFERTTRKPTNRELISIDVHAKDFSSFLQDLSLPVTSRAISSFRAGEWLVDLLCLIPIHIAITKDNRFIPLKDGVWSPDVERSLLGAEVGHIVDNITFGWYESIFRSYMITRVCFAAMNRIWPHNLI